MWIRGWYTIITESRGAHVCLIGYQWPLVWPVALTKFICSTTFVPVAATMRNYYGRTNGTPNHSHTKFWFLIRGYRSGAVFVKTQKRPWRWSYRPIRVANHRGMSSWPVRLLWIMGEPMSTDLTYVIEETLFDKLHAACQWWWPEETIFSRLAIKLAREAGHTSVQACSRSHP